METIPCSVRIRIIQRDSAKQTETNHTVEVDGDGDLDHLVQAFSAAMIAAGWSTETAGRLDKLLS